MKTKFPIKEGTLEFFEDHIEIKDKWKFARLQYYYLVFISLFASISLLVQRKEAEEIRWIWLVLLIIITIVLLFRIFNPKKRIFDIQLQIDQIDKVVMESYSYDRLSAVFYLKNGTRRLVDLDFDRFWRADFEQSLAETNIESKLL